MPTSRIGQWLLVAAILCSGIILPLIAKQLWAATRFNGCGGEEVASANADYETQLVELVNAFRAEQGLPPLKLNQALSNAARYHATDMVQDEYFQHNTYDRVDGELTAVCVWYDRVNVYYPISGAAENIAWGYNSPAEVMAGWVASEGHRNNMLSGNWEIGVGFYDSVWVQDFSRRRDYYPLIINGDAATTTSVNVALYMYGEWDEMRLRNDDGSWSEWQPFASEVNWELNAIPGERVVEAELRTANNSTTTSDTITLQLDNAATPSPTATATDDPNRTNTETPTATATPILTSTPPGDTPTPTPTFFVATPPTCSNCIDGRVIFEGRPDPPHASWVTPIVVKLIAYGNDHNEPRLLTLPGETSPDGRFRLYDVTPGPYEILVKGSHTLQRGVTVTVTAGLSEVVIGLLPEGDVLANNRVDILDFSLLASVYESCADSSTYLSAADLNADGCVNEQDFLLLLANFGRTGDEAGGLSAVTAASAAPRLDLHDMAAGKAFAVDVAITDAATTPVDGGAFYVNFDPNLLQVVSVVVNNQLPIRLQDGLDETHGRVDFAAGILGGSVQPPFTFATINFITRQPIAQSQIALELGGERRTELAARGASLIDQAPGGAGSIIQLSINQFEPTSALYLPLVLR